MAVVGGYSKAVIIALASSIAAVDSVSESAGLRTIVGGVYRFGGVRLSLLLRQWQF